MDKKVEKVIEYMKDYIDNYIFQDNEPELSVSDLKVLIDYIDKIKKTNEILIDVNVKMLELVEHVNNE